MNEIVLDLLNKQINKELYSAYLYLDIAGYYCSIGLDGFEHWFKIQAEEEKDHAMKFYQYLQDNGLLVSLEAIDKPIWEKKDKVEPLKKALEHEKYVTSLIEEIYLQASKVNDLKTMRFLDWFIIEQQEEEKNASDLVNKMLLYGSEASSLYLLNQELKSRRYEVT